MPASGQAAIANEYSRASRALCLGVAFGLAWLVTLFCWCRFLQKIDLDVGGLTDGFKGLFWLLIPLICVLGPPAFRAFNDGTGIKQAFPKAFSTKPYFEKHPMLPEKLKAAICLWYVLLAGLAVLAFCCYGYILLAPQDIQKERGFLGGAGILLLIVVECIFWHHADHLIRVCEDNPVLANAISDIKAKQRMLLCAVQVNIKDNDAVIASAKSNAQIINALCLAWNTYGDNEFCAKEVLSACMMPFLRPYLLQKEKEKRETAFDRYCKPLFTNISGKLCRKLTSNGADNMFCQIRLGSCPVLDVHKSDYKGDCPYYKICMPEALGLYELARMAFVADLSSVHEDIDFSDAFLDLRARLTAFSSPAPQTATTIPPVKPRQEERSHIP